MCLELKPTQRLLKTAKKDIPVFKVLTRNPVGGLVQTPIRGYNAPLNELLPSELDRVPFLDWFKYTRTEIHLGIHAFLDENVAYEALNLLTSQYVTAHWNTRRHNSYRINGAANKVSINFPPIDHEPYALYNCVIPTGSKYYVGMWGGTNYTSTASDQLIILNRID